MSLYVFSIQVHKGVRGLVKDKSGKPVTGASIVLNRRMKVFTSKEGYFHVLLAPGDYSIEAIADGYQQQQFKVSLYLLRSPCFRRYPDSTHLSQTGTFLLVVHLNQVRWSRKTCRRMGDEDQGTLVIYNLCSQTCLEDELVQLLLLPAECSYCNSFSIGHFGTLKTP